MPENLFGYDLIHELLKSCFLSSNTVSLQALDIAKQARVYELIKDRDHHKAIIDVSSKDAGVEALIVSIVNGLRMNDDTLVDNAETGLTNIADRVAKGPPFPAFKDLTSKVVKQLSAFLENREFAALLKDPSEISSNGTMFSVPFDVKDPGGEETVTRVVLGAAFREAKNHGLSLKEFKDACSSIFKEDSTHFKSALKFVTRDAEAALSKRSQEQKEEDDKILLDPWLDSVLEKMFNFAGSLSNAQEQANNDTGSSKSDTTYYNKMKVTAKTALIKWCEGMGCGDDAVVDLNRAIFKI